MYRCNGKTKKTNKPSNDYLQTVEIPSVKIFRYSGSLNFASRQYFREEVYKVAGLVPQKELNRWFAAEAEEVKKVGKK